MWVSWSLSRTLTSLVNYPTVQVAFELFLPFSIHSASFCPFVLGSGWTQQPPVKSQAIKEKTLMLVNTTQHWLVLICCNDCYTSVLKLLQPPSLRHCLLCP